MQTIIFYHWKNSKVFKSTESAQLWSLSKSRVRLAPLSPLLGRPPVLGQQHPGQIAAVAPAPHGHLLAVDVGQPLGQVPV